MTGATIYEPRTESTEQAPLLQRGRNFRMNNAREFSNLCHIASNTNQRHVLLYGDNVIYEPSAEEIFIYAPDEALMIRCRPKETLHTRIGDITDEFQQRLGYKNLQACFRSVYNGRIKPEGYGSILVDADPVIEKPKRADPDKKITGFFF